MTQDTTHTAYKPGSPPDRILNAGRKLFFDRGFQAVSTDLLAKEAGVSKATIYRYFPNLQGLLVTVTALESRHFQAQKVPIVGSLDQLEQELIGYGERLMGFLNQADVFKFSQLMHEEARSQPEVASAFYEAAFGQTIGFLTDLIQQGHDQGWIRTDLTAEEMAYQLVGMWEGVPMVRSYMGVTERPFADPQGWSKKCVHTLLK